MGTNRPVYSGKKQGIQLPGRQEAIARKEDVALKIIIKLIEEKRTALVVREVYDTLRDSTFYLFEEINVDMEFDRSRLKCVSTLMKIRFLNAVLFNVRCGWEPLNTAKMF